LLTRRRGATIDIDLSHVKFLGNLTLNLWDCGGQEAFMDNYLSQQRQHVFSNVGVLIYVFDIESHDVDRDMTTYFNIIYALAQYSPSAKVFVLIHKMDLIVPAQREQLFDERYAQIRRRTQEMVASTGGIATQSGDLDLCAFATSIWDQSLYKAWASIIHDLVPNLGLIEEHLAHLGVVVEAEEIILFERTSFLVISSWSSPAARRPNPYADRFERISNIMKAWKQSAAKYSGTPRNAEQFRDYELRVGTSFACFLTKFTANTFVGVVLPPGEARFNAAKLNTRIAAEWFKFLDGGSLAQHQQHQNQQLGQYGQQQHGQLGASGMRDGSGSLGSGGSANAGGSSTAQ
jgi:Ras-related GTP-binding protein A/B